MRSFTPVLAGEQPFLPLWSWLPVRNSTGPNCYIFLCFHFVHTSWGNVGYMTLESQRPRCSAPASTSLLKCLLRVLPRCRLELADLVGSLGICPFSSIIPPGSRLADPATRAVHQRALLSTCCRTSVSVA